MRQGRENPEPAQREESRNAKRAARRGRKCQPQIATVKKGNRISVRGDKFSKKT